MQCCSLRQQQQQQQRAFKGKISCRSLACVRETKGEIRPRLGCFGARWSACAARAAGVMGMTSREGWGTCAFTELCAAG
jgi:hypothetical protein